MRLTLFILVALLIPLSVFSQIKLDFSSKRGFYTQTFQLTLSSDDPAATIRYTTNGTAPTTSSGTFYNGPISINTTKNIRAIAYTANATSKVYTHSYIFLADVPNQPYSVNGFPATDFDFHSSINNDAYYSNQLQNALTQIGSISIVMDLIDMDAVHNGIDERATSMEILYADGRNHQEDCGIERFGGTSFNNNKRNFRLSFKDIYGVSKLNYPLFDTPVKSYDQIALRAGHAGCLNKEGTSLYTGESNDIADQVVRNFQIKIQEDGVGIAGNFMHLYLNGIYWGVYNLTERPVTGWAKKYYGGEKDDWDVIKVKAVLHGNQTAWNNLNYYANNTNLAYPSNYNQIQQYIDVEQFADFVIVTNFAPHGDNHASGKNAYLSRNRNDNHGFRFWLWDSEPSLGYYWPKGWTVDHVGHSAFNNIFYSLLDNSDFKTLLGDRMHCHCFEDGELTPAKAKATYDEVYNTIDVAMIAEAARWGTSYGYEGIEDARNRIVNTYLSSRTNSTINNYKNAGIYPTVNGVQASHQGGVVPTGTAITLSNPNSGGTIYYTLDGSDPRASGGSISSNALSYNGSFTLPYGVIELKARVRRNGVWSAMCPKRFFVGQNYSNIVINEIMYHSDSLCHPTDIDELDFLELHNRSNQPIDLADCSFSDGFTYKFPFPSTIPAGGFLVLAENGDEFYNAYGFQPFGQYNGQLSNSSDRLELNTPEGLVIDSLSYADENPWDIDPDGYGPSLELLSPTFDNNEPLNWFRSDQDCGTPGAANSRVCNTTAETIVINEINYNSNNSAQDPGDWIELYNPGPNPVNLSGWSFHDNNNDYSFPSGMVIEADAYIVLIENSLQFTSIFPNVSNTLGNLPFSLSNKGERISLFNPSKCLSDYVTFDDRAPWDTLPDGNGPTLSLIAPSMDNALPQSWQASAQINAPLGTPGRANEPCPVYSLTVPSTICTDESFWVKLNGSAFESVTWEAFGGVVLQNAGDSAQIKYTNLGIGIIKATVNYYECSRALQQLINAQACNLPPIAVLDSYTTLEDLAYGYNVLNNDIDPEGQPLTATLLTSVSNGTLSFAPNGYSIYTPSPNFHGTDSFEYEVCESQPTGLCAQQTVFITVTSVNDAPIAVDEQYDIDDGDFLLDDLSTNDYDVDVGTVLNYFPIVYPLHGNLGFNSNGPFNYSHFNGFTGIDSFTYRVCDDGIPQLCDTATATITVNPVCLTLNVSAFLEGAYTANASMTTSLNFTRKLLPGMTNNPTSGQPYTIPPWNYPGIEGIGWTESDYHPDAVDWVLVSLRTGLPKASEVYQIAGLLFSDGGILWPEGCPTTALPDPAYYIVLEHRNHMAVISHAPIPIINRSITYDFRVEEGYTIGGNSQKEIEPGVWALYAGDGDQIKDVIRYDINGSDKLLWNLQNGNFGQYLPSDFNFDGDVNGGDRSLWMLNNGVFGAVQK